MAAVDDGGGGAGRTRPREEIGHHVERSLGGRKPDALEPVPLGLHQCAQPLEAQCEMGSALVTGQGVHLVDDHGVNPLEHGPGRRRREEQVEGLGGGDQQVGRRPSHGRPLGRRGVAGPHGHREIRRGKPQPCGLFGDAGERPLQVLVDVDGERPQRGDVDHPGPEPGCGLLRGFGPGPVGGVDRHQKTGERLAGSGRGGHQHVGSGHDVWPRPTLRLGGPGREAPEEPAGHRRMERAEDRVLGEVVESCPAGGRRLPGLHAPDAGRG